MTAFDYIVLGILLASSLLGAMRGFIKEVFSLSAFVISFVAALWWGPRLIPFLSQYLDQQILIVGLSYFLVFIVALLVVGLLSKTLNHLLVATGLGPADRGLGFIFGLIRGVLIVVIVIIIASYSALPQEDWWSQSKLLPTFVQLIHEIKIHLPDGVQQYLPY